MPWRKWLARAVPPVVLMAGIVAGLELFVRVAGVSSYVVPRPSAVVRSVVDDAGELSRAFLTTAEAAAVGFAAAAVAGIFAAIAMSASPLVRRAFYPYTVFFQTVPLVAVAPLLVIWFDAGIPAVAASAAVVGIFPVVTNTLAGLLATDPALLDLFRLYNARPLDRLLKLQLPHALPSLVVGLRISAGLCVIGAVVAEFLVGTLGDREGLGVKITAAMHVGRTDRVFAAVAATSLLGFLMLAAVDLLARLLLRRHYTGN